MRLKYRLVQLSVSAAAITIVGCGPSLPDAPLVLSGEVPQQSAPVTPPPAPPASVSPPQVSASPTPPAPATEARATAAPTAQAPTNPEPATSPSETDSQLPEVTLTTQTVAQTPAVPDGELPFEVLHKASYNPFDRDNGKNFRALKSVQFYQSELARHSIETVKPIDFSTNQVLVSSIGEKPSGGYTITVAKIEETDENVVVTVVQTIPGPSCVTTEGKTYPFEFVTVPSLKPIEIFERQRVQEC